MQIEQNEEHVGQIGSFKCDTTSPSDAPEPAPLSTATSQPASTSTTQSLAPITISSLLGTSEDYNVKPDECQAVSDPRPSPFDFKANNVGEFSECYIYDDSTNCGHSFVLAINPYAVENQRHDSGIGSFKCTSHSNQPATPSDPYVEILY